MSQEYLLGGVRLTIWQQNCLNLETVSDLFSNGMLHLDARVHLAQIRNRFWVDSEQFNRNSPFFETQPKKNPPEGMLIML